MTRGPLPPLIMLTLALSLAAACSSAPAASPTTAPAAQPTTPAVQPTAAPTKAPQPTVAPTAAPTAAPAAAPTAAPKAAAANLTEMSFEQITTTGSDTTSGKTAIKNGKMWSEMTVMGQQMTIIVDTEKKVVYMLAAGQNQAMKLPYDQYETQAGGVANPGSATQGKLTGTETVDGQLCDVYEKTESFGTIKTWIAKSNGFPVKSETTTSLGVSKTEFKNVKIGGVPDSLFELPAGVQVVDMGNIPGLSGGGMPGGAGGAIPGRPNIPTPTR